MTDLIIKRWTDEDKDLDNLQPYIPPSDFLHTSVRINGVIVTEPLDSGTSAPFLSQIFEPDNFYLFERA